MYDFPNFSKQSYRITLELGKGQCVTSVIVTNSEKYIFLSKRKGGGENLKSGISRI